MFLICSSVCIILGIITYKREKELLNPITLLSLLYGISSFLSGLRLFDTVKTNDFIYIIILIGMISSFIGYFFSNKIAVKKNWRNNFNLLVIKIMIIFVVVFSTYQLSQVWELIRGGTELDNIRMIYYGTTVDNVSMNTVIKQLEVYINLPFIYILIVILANFLLDKSFINLKKRYIILIIYGIIITQLASGGRMIFLYFMANLFFAYSLRNKLNLKKFFIKYKKIIFILTSFFCLILYVSVNRNDDSQTLSIFYTAYIYLVCPYVIFSYHFPVFFNNTTFGMSLISGFIRPFIEVIEKIIGLHIASLDKIYDVATYVTANPVLISSKGVANSFSTMFSYFYMDGHLIGVVFESFIMMFFVSIFYKKMKKYNTKYYVILYCLLLQSLVFSFIRYQYIVVSMALPIYYSLFLFKRKGE